MCAKIAYLSLVLTAPEHDAAPAHAAPGEDPRSEQEILSACEEVMNYSDESWKGWRGGRFQR